MFHKRRMWAALYGFPDALYHASMESTKSVGVLAASSDEALDRGDFRLFLRGFGGCPRPEGTDEDSLGF